MTCNVVLYITVNQPAKACRVVPATRHAAAPVLAVATVFSGGSAAIMCLNKKDLPVPALPVNIKKTHSFMNNQKQKIIRWTQKNLYTELRNTIITNSHSGSFIVTNCVMFGKNCIASLKEKSLSGSLAA